MERGSVFLIIVSFLLLKKEVLGEEEGILSPNSKLRESESYKNGESRSLEAGPSRSLHPPRPAQEVPWKGIVPKPKQISSSKFFFYKPVPMKLVHKSTIKSGPVDEGTFREIENELNINIFSDTIKNNEIFSTEDSSFHNSRGKNRFPPNNRISSSSQYPQTKKLFSNKLIPIPGTITGYFASPGKEVRSINSGSTSHTLENTLFKRNNFKGFVEKPASFRSNPFFTITPGVVKSFPIKIMSDNPTLRTDLEPLNNINDIGSTIFKRYIPSLQNSLRKSSFRSSKRIDAKPSPSNNVKIVVLSKVPSKDQPDSFWKNLFRLTPQLSKQHQKRETSTQVRRKPQNNFQIYRSTPKRITPRKHLSSS